MRCCDVGDAAARGLLCKLLRAGCAPYFKTLEQWLCEGVLDDPFCEFMVQENLVRPASVTLPTATHLCFEYLKHSRF